MKDTNALPQNVETKSALAPQAGPLDQEILGDLRQEYTEASNNHRHYSNLRFASLTLYFAIIGALASVAFGVLGRSSVAINARFWATVAGLLITLTFFLFEVLNEKNLRHFISVLKALETRLGYTQITSKPRHPAVKARFATYTLFILFVIFWLYTLIQIFLPTSSAGRAQSPARALQRPAVAADEEYSVLRRNREDESQMDAADTGFFGTVMTGGAIIAAFCGSFLVFRIQREAEYFRNPAQGYLGQQCFSQSFLLLILATSGATLAGVVLPLLGLSGVRAPFLTPKAVVAGLFGAIVLLGGYFINELVHYRIIFERWRGDREGWGREWPLAITLILSSIVTLLSCLWLLP